MTKPELTAVTTARQNRRPHHENKKLVLAVRVALIAATLGLWQVASGRWLATYIISSPSAVWDQLIEYITSQRGWSDIWLTTQEFVIGFFIGAVAGVVIGLVLAQSRFLGAVMVPVVAAVNAVPKIALAPLFLIILGLGIWSKVVVASLSVFFVLFYTVYQGVREQPTDLVEVMKVMGANRATIIRRVLTPAAMPYIIAGLRSGIPHCMIGVIVGEFMASSEGVGYFINSETQQFNTAGTFTGVIVMIAMTMFANTLLTIFEQSQPQARIRRMK